MAKEPTANSANLLRPVYDHRAMLTSTQFTRFDGLLRNPMDVMAWANPLKPMANGNFAMREMLIKDPQISAQTELAIQSVNRLGFTIDYEDVPDDIRAYWESLEADPRRVLRNAIDSIIQALAWGITGAAVQYEPDYPGLRPAKVYRASNDWFVLDVDGNAHRVMPSRNIETEPIEPDQFILAKYNADTEYPYGRGWLIYCFWPFIFKKQSILYWLDALDRFVNPQMILTAPHGTANLVNTVARSSKDDVIGIDLAKEGTFTFREPKGKEIGSSYQAAIDYWDGAISKLVTGAELVTDEGGRVGSLALGRVHDDQFIAKTLERAVWVRDTVQAEVFNRWNRLRFGVDAPIPKFNVPTEPTQDDKLLIEIDKILADMLERLGYGLDPEVLGGKYGATILPLEDIPGYDGRPVQITDIPDLTGGDLTATMAVSDVKKKLIQRARVDEDLKDGLIQRGIFRTLPILTEYKRKYEGLIKSGNPKTVEKKLPGFFEKSNFAELYGASIANEVMIAYVVGWYRAGLQHRNAATFVAADAPDITSEMIYGAETWADLVYVMGEKIPVDADIFYALEAKLKAKYTTIARLRETAVMERLIALITEALSSATAWTTEQFIAGANAELAAAGIDPLKPWHLAQVYRTNQSLAFEAAHEDFIFGNKLEDKVNLMYVTARDEAVRPTHAALEGRVMTAREWKTTGAWAPNGYNCRCSMVDVPRGVGIRPAKGLPKGWEPAEADKDFTLSPSELFHAPVAA